MRELFKAIEIPIQGILLMDWEQWSLVIGACMLVWIMHTTPKEKKSAKREDIDITKWS